MASMRLECEFEVYLHFLTRTSSCLWLIIHSFRISVNVKLKFLKLLVMGGFKGDSGNENMNQFGSLQPALLASFL